MNNAAFQKSVSEVPFWYSARLGRREGIRKSIEQDAVNGRTEGAHLRYVWSAARLQILSLHLFLSIETSSG